jgi:hypothetical protein
MSMPQILVLAVISGEVSFKKDAQDFGGEKASAVAAILTGKNSETRITPYIIPVAFTRCRMSFIQSVATQGYAPIGIKPVYPRLLNPQEIDVWFALDKEGVQEAQKRIAQQGVSTSAYYREVFPDPVLYCGFSVPNPPIESNFQDWFNLLIGKFEPWKKRFWKAFEDSS